MDTVQERVGPRTGDPADRALFAPYTHETPKRRICNRFFQKILKKIPGAVLRELQTYFVRMNSTPRVPGPQWQETVQPARVS